VVLLSVSTAIPESYARAAVLLASNNINTRAFMMGSVCTLEYATSMPSFAERENYFVNTS
jgi:hypothetical protein